MNPFTQSGLFYLYSVERSISSRRDDWLVIILLCFMEIPHLFNVNSIDTDQAPRSVASDLGLYCLSMF